MSIESTTAKRNDSEQWHYNNIAQQSSEIKAKCNEEESFLWGNYLACDKNNEELHLQLVEYYLPFVIKIARNINIQDTSTFEFEDLVNTGVLGLHNAIKNYTPQENSAFSTFAYKRVRGAILDELRKLDKLTRTQRGNYRKIRNAINEISAEKRRPAKDLEIAEKTGFTVAEVDYYIELNSKQVQLDEEFADGLSYSETLADSSVKTPEETTHNLLAIEALKQHIYKLNEREQKILYLRHFEELSVKEIAQVLGISEGRISQIYKKVLLKLRSMME
ncbi:FliA/WhiG family RNA polymerase sigma factor [Lentisphaerota bacterium WC36G]|nr:FliA/WhiG family RNA polymerase sigma factor [Lentisphaerae bacterium WC36]